MSKRSCLLTLITLGCATLITSQSMAQNILTSERVRTNVQQAYNALKSGDEDTIENFFKTMAKDKLKVTLKTEEETYSLSERDMDEDAVEAFALNLSGPADFAKNHIGRAAKSAGGRFSVSSFRATTTENADSSDFPLNSGSESDLKIESYATRCVYQLKIANRDQVEFIKLECEAKSG